MVENSAGKLSQSSVSKSFFASEGTLTNKGNLSELANIAITCSDCNLLDKNRWWSGLAVG